MQFITNGNKRNLQILAAALLAASVGLGCGFLLGRFTRTSLPEPSPGEAPLSSESLKTGWEKAVQFDRSGDGAIY